MKPLEVWTEADLVFGRRLVDNTFSPSPLLRILGQVKASQEFTLLESMVADPKRATEIDQLERML